MIEDPSKTGASGLEVPAEQDYYLDESGNLVMTRAYHLKRGYCCGAGCRHCPFDHENVPPSGLER